MNPYIKLPKVPIVYGRHDAILRRCRDKEVLHLGCVDRGYHYKKFERRELMHQKLAGVAKELWGIDIDKKGIEYLRQHGFRNLLVGDVCKLGDLKVLQNRFFDVIIASEILEHLENPGLFLDGIKTLMIPGRTELIITIPNAFRLDTLIWLFRGVEYVHPDHNFWFSYSTARNLLIRNDFKIEKVYSYSFQPYWVFPKGMSRIRKNSGGDVLELNKIKSFPNVTKNMMKFYRLTLNYIKSLPRRVVVSFLYRRTPFWGDGIIFIVKIYENKD